MSTSRKKLIEVALPLDDINAACKREKSIRHGHPSTLHLWWARRPLAAARAVIFAQMVDDPGSIPGLSDEEVVKERERLFDLIRELVKWENTNNEEVLNQARAEIKKSWARTCEETGEDPEKLPAFHDPFAGGGTLPLEAQRLGLESCASDLNPVAVLINKAMIEIPPKFAGMPPVNLEAHSKKSLIEKEWKSAGGLAEDVRYYAEWMRDEADERIGHLYPKVKITNEMVTERPDLEKYRGQELTVIAWLWARTVKSPNPAFSQVDVPLISTFILSTIKGKEAYVEPIVNGSVYLFRIRRRVPLHPMISKSGTKTGRGVFQCLISGSVINTAYIRSEAQAGRMGRRLLAIIAEGRSERVFLDPQSQSESLAFPPEPIGKPNIPVPTKCHDVDRLPMYGMFQWGDAFTSRQQTALVTFSELVRECWKKVRKDAAIDFYRAPRLGYSDADSFAHDYADAIATYTGLGVGRSVNYWSSLTPWAGNFIVQTFGRNALRMVWDHAEANPFSDSTGNWSGAINWICKVLETSLPASQVGIAVQMDAQKQIQSKRRIVSTDPPYFDNIGYAELSDFFYVWLRPCLKDIYPKLLSTIVVPKSEELVSAAHRHGGKVQAEKFFMGGMTSAMQRIAEQAHPAFPVTIYYAFKQSESKKDEGTVSTGWETFLDAVIEAGLNIIGTWPIRTERDQGLKTGSNVLASSIVLVCRKRPEDAPITTRRDFIRTLRAELPSALQNLQKSNIAPVDLAQSSIGPGMAVFSKYKKVIEADGSAMTVRSALQLINQVLDESLGAEEGALDGDTRFAVTWFETHQYQAGPFGEADNLARARNVSVQGVQEAGVLHSAAGKVRLFTRAELPKDWDPEADKRLTVWEATQHLIKRLEEDGEEAAATLLKKLGPMAEQARNLAYRLYTTCERNKWAEEARAYNGLVIAWPELEKLASKTESTSTSGTQAELFD